jgi:hypothetical protein
MPITFEKKYGGKFPYHVDADGHVIGDGRCPKFAQQGSDEDDSFSMAPGQGSGRRSNRSSSRSKTTPQSKQSGPNSSKKPAIDDSETNDRASPDSSEGTEAWTNPFSGIPANKKKSTRSKGNKKPSQTKYQKHPHNEPNSPHSSDVTPVSSPPIQEDESACATRIVKINTDLLSPFFYYRVATSHVVNLGTRRAICDLASSLFGGNWILSHPVTSAFPSQGGVPNTLVEGDFLANANVAQNRVIDSDAAGGESVPGARFLLLSDISVPDDDLVNFISMLATLSDATSGFKAPFGLVEWITRQENVIPGPWDIASMAAFGLVGGMLESITNKLIPPASTKGTPDRPVLVLDHTFIPLVTNGQPAILMHVEKNAMGMDNLSSILRSSLLEPKDLVGHQVKDTTSTFHGVIVAIIGTLGENQNRQRLIQLTQKPSTKIVLESAPDGDLILGVASGEHVYEYITSMLLLVQPQGPSPPALISQFKGSPKTDDILVDFINLCNNPARFIDRIIELIQGQYPDLLKLSE